MVNLYSYATLFHPAALSMPRYKSYPFLHFVHLRQNSIHPNFILHQCLLFLIESHNNYSTSIIPSFQAGMVWASGWRLASAVSNAGGLGLIGSGSMNPDVLREHIRKCKTATSKPFGVNLPLLYSQIDKQVQIIIEEGVKIIFSSAGNPATWDERLKRKGNICCTCCGAAVNLPRKLKMRAAMRLWQEGFEAGGHNGREETTTFVLVPAVCEAVKIPVIAAGGIATGKQMLASMVLRR